MAARGVEPVVVKPCRVVAVVSGGPDSFGYMLLWLSRGCKVHAMTFKYGQKAAREVEVAARLVSLIARAPRREGWGEVVEHKIIDLSALREVWTGTQLTDEEVRVEEEYKPTVVVPIRNVLMLSVATAYAFTLAERHPGERVYVAYGAQYCDVKPRGDTWEPLYPDSSPECVESLQAAFRICHFRASRGIELWSPSREGLGKPEILRLAHSLVGGLVYETWSCYQSGRLHCGVCESCRNRHRAFREAGIPDCTPYQEPPGDPGEFVWTGEYYIHRSCSEATR